MQAPSVPLGISLTSPVTWFMIVVAGIVVALTITTNRRNRRGP